MDSSGPAKPPEKRKVGGSTPSQSPSGDWPGQKSYSTRVQHSSRPRTPLKAAAAQRLATTTINALAALEFASRGSPVRQLALGSPDLIPEICWLPRAPRSWSSILTAHELAGRFASTSLLCVSGFVFWRPDPERQRLLPGRDADGRRRISSDPYVAVYSSYPSGPSTWTIVGGNYGAPQTPVPIIAYATCVQADFSLGLTIASSTVTDVRSGTPANVIASCPASSTVLGGGPQSTYRGRPSQFSDLPIAFSSYPNDLSSWTADVAPGNLGASGILTKDSRKDAG
jgi:hypothetical protein